MSKSLISKLQKIKKQKYRPRDFIIADAKDGDMAMGITAPGQQRDNKGKILKSYRNLNDYKKAMIDMTKSQLVDIMLMSASVGEDLIEKKTFETSSVTPAIRMNDTSDIWLMRNGNYRTTNPRPFQSARIEKISKLVNLGLFSITFSKNVDFDLAMLNAYKNFRKDALKYKLNHFLEIFNPPIDVGMRPKELGDYVNDCIIKAIAGQTNEERPLFLKIAYNGPKAMEDLSSYDPENLVVGILGGSKGTTRDCFELIKKASKYGAKVALFGRKINLSEDPISLVEIMRNIVEKDISSSDAVKLYHDRLKKKKLMPDRSLKNDIKITDPILKL
tara:strand:+ start:1865 stop:2857 length:993 start_codon:yes stop_codon:yes gene_type:complete